MRRAVGLAMLMCAGWDRSSVVRRWVPPDGRPQPQLPSPTGWRYQQLDEPTADVSD